jgi:hypothetical protein
MPKPFNLPEEPQKAFPDSFNPYQRLLLLSSIVIFFARRFYNSSQGTDYAGKALSS